MSSNRTIAVATEKPGMSADRKAAVWTMGAIAGRFGLSFDLSDVPDLVSRYGLIPPGGVPR